MPQRPLPVADLSGMRAASGPFIHHAAASRTATVQPRAALARSQAVIERTVRSPHKFTISIGATRIVAGLVLGCASVVRGAQMIHDERQRSIVGLLCNMGWLVAGFVLAYYGMENVDTGRTMPHEDHRGTSLPRSLLTMAPTDSNVILLVAGAAGAISGGVGHALLQREFGWWTPVTGLTVVGPLLAVQALACLYRQHVLAAAPRQGAGLPQPVLAGDRP
jgi:hypothetical protein